MANTTQLGLGVLPDSFGVFLVTFALAVTLGSCDRSQRETVSSRDDSVPVDSGVTVQSLLDGGSPDYRELAEALKELELRDPHGALMLLDQIKDRKQVFNSLLRLVDKVPAEDLPTIFEMAGERLVGQQAFGIKNDVFKRLSSVDPNAGWDLVDKTSAGSDRQTFLGTFVGNFSPEVAIEQYGRLAQLPFEEDRNTASGSLRMRLRNADADFLRRELVDGQPEEKLAEFLGYALAAAVARDGGSLENATSGMPASAVAPMVHSWATTASSLRPEEVAQAISAGDFPAEQALAVVGAVAGNYAGQSPKEAAIWAADFSDGPLQEQAIAMSMSSWLNRASEDASSWVLQLPEGKARELASAEVVRHLTQVGDLESAVQWYDSISDEAAKKTADFSLRTALERQKGKQKTTEPQN